MFQGFHVILQRNRTKEVIPPLERSLFWFNWHTSCKRLIKVAHLLNNDLCTFLISLFQGLWFLLCPAAEIWQHKFDRIEVLVGKALVGPGEPESSSVGLKGPLDSGVAKQASMILDKLRGELRRLGFADSGRGAAAADLGLVYGKDIRDLLRSTICNFGKLVLCTHRDHL